MNYSGYKFNIIPKQVWELMKIRGIETRNRTGQCDRTLVAVGVEKLDVVGSFPAEIECGRESTDARFYVLGKGQDCWYTAQVLKVISFDETRVSSC